MEIKRIRKKRNKTQKSKKNQSRNGVTKNETNERYIRKSNIITVERGRDKLIEEKEKRGELLVR